MSLAAPRRLEDRRFMGASFSAFAGLASSAIILEGRDRQRIPNRSCWQAGFFQHFQPGLTDAESSTKRGKIMWQSWKIGSAFGIPIKVHWSFLLLPLWILLSQSATPAVA